MEMNDTGTGKTLQLAWGFFWGGGICGGGGGLHF